MLTYSVPGPILPTIHTNIYSDWVFYHNLYEIHPIKLGIFVWHEKPLNITQKSTHVKCVYHRPSRYEIFHNFMFLGLENELHMDLHQKNQEKHVFKSFLHCRLTIQYCKSIPACTSLSLQGRLHNITLEISK